MSTFKSIAQSLNETGFEMYDVMAAFTEWFTEHNNRALANGTSIQFLNREIAEQLDCLNDGVHASIERAITLYGESDILALKLGLDRPERVVLSNTKKGVHVVFE